MKDYRKADGNISLLFNKYNDKNCIILGNGVSIKQLETKSIDDDITTIGCNSIQKAYNPDILTLVDRFKNKSHKSPDTQEFIDMVNNSPTQVIVTAHYNWCNVLSQDKTYLQFMGSPLLKFDINRVEKFPLELFTKSNSPFATVQMAYNMGFKNIGLLGVDYTLDHFYKKDGSYFKGTIEQIKWQRIQNNYKTMTNFLQGKGIGFYNLSKVSLLKMIKYKSLEDFNALV